MKDIIKMQFEILESYKYYDKKKALRMNKGGMEAFFLNLLAYEKDLSDKQMSSIDKMLERKYLKHKELS